MDHGSVTELARVNHGGPMQSRGGVRRRNSGGRPILRCSVMRKQIKRLVTATNLYATFFRGPPGYDKLRTAGYGSRGAFSRGREKRRVY